MRTVKTFMTDGDIIYRASKHMMRKMFYWGTKLRDVNLQDWFNAKRF